MLKEPGTSWLSTIDQMTLFGSVKSDLDSVGRYLILQIKQFANSSIYFVDTLPKYQELTARSRTSRFVNAFFQHFLKG
jgi:hypothetical protein